MDLMHIPLSELSIAKTNVRHGVKKADYEDLIPSIRQRGILQPLLVRKSGKGYEIVAGRRRYLAVQSLEKEGLEIGAIPCAIMANGDDAAAVEASLIENIQRLPIVNKHSNGTPYRHAKGTPVCHYKEAPGERCA